MCLAKTKKSTDKDILQTDGPSVVASCSIQSKPNTARHTGWTLEWVTTSGIKQQFNYQTTLSVSNNTVKTTRSKDASALC